MANQKKLTEHEHILAYIKEKTNGRIKELGISKATLAERIGMSPSTLSHCLGKHGTRELTVSEFYDICIALKIRPEALVPIAAAMTEDEKADPILRTALGLDAPKLTKTGNRLVRMISDLPTNLQ